ncbi:MAG: hypothetical protein CO118_00025 [Flavobacteriales bacterium CG_4_9_14_3_um_filter_32_8]|nr:MAG: hypothetical protein CO118_00025 [Flavobacteriales bacterium CG_4_9_14_3_um_filter_32_8]
MKNSTTLLAIVISGLLLISTTTFAQYQIGHTTITFQDPNRGNRAIQTEIYYPATTAGTNTPAVQDSFPVIIFGHGFVMAWDAYQNLWEEFVPRGYIMAFPRTEGNMLSTDHQQFGWDLQFLIVRMQTEGATFSSLLYGVVASETALMGHSMGGGAAFLAADSLSTNGNTNLKTLIGFAPAESSTNGVSSINSALSVTVPSVVLSGSNDGVAPAVDHATPMYNNLASSCKTFINILGGGHCYFANTNFNCDFGESTSSTGISITRAEQQDITYDFVNTWLDYTLKGDCNAFAIFNDSLSLSSKVTFNQTCVPNPVPTINYTSGQLVSTVTGLSYTWYLNGTPIANSNQLSIIPTQTGNYTVVVFFQDGCSEISAPYSFITTLINEHTTTTFSVYPNPAKNKVIINGANELVIEMLQIFNYAGMEVTNYSLNDNVIDVANFVKGLYLLKINNQWIKLVIE